MSVLYPMLLMATGEIIMTKKLSIHLDKTEIAEPLEQRRKVGISNGYKGYKKGVAIQPPTA